MKIYVAGPMSFFRESNQELFAAATLAIESKTDYQAVNPYLLTEASRGFGGQNSEFVRRDVMELTNCVGLCLLPFWFMSLGARAEFAVSRWLGFNIYYGFSHSEGLVKIALPDALHLDNTAARREAFCRASLMSYGVESGDNPIVTWEDHFQRNIPL